MKKNSENKGLHLVNKSLGETPHEAILRFKKENPEYDFLPMTYAGRLDPMAEGLLLLLSGEEVHNKEKYLALRKKYIFEILWGLETDTHDILGIVSDFEVLNSSEIPSEEKVKEHLKNNIGKFEQYYPMYSSRPVGGKPLFEWARQGKIGEIEIPKHEVEIYDAEFIERKEIKSEEILKDVLKKIDLVKGDFRQEEIKENWRKVLDNNQKFVVDKIEVDVSSGFYVRQFTTDFAKSLNSRALTYSIKRISVGEYALK